MISYSYSKQNWLYLLAAMFCAGFFVLLPAFTSAGKTFYNLLGLMAVVFVLVNWRSIQSLKKEEKTIIWLVILFAGWAVLTYLVNGSPCRGARFLWSRQIFIILLPVIFLLLRHLDYPTKFYFNVFLISSIALLAMGVYEVVQQKNASLLDIGEYRVKGSMHPIQFGSISLIFLSFISSYVFLFRKNVFEKLFILIVAVCMAASVIYSQARGVWLALVLMPVIWLLYYPSRVSVSRKIIIISLLVIGVLFSYFIKPVQERVDVTVQNLASYYNSENIEDEERETSLGTRLEMWKASYLIASENPVFGVGLGGYESAARGLSKQDDVSKSAFSFYHPHNQFMSEIASKGIPGLIIYVSILLFLAKYYSSKLRNSNSRQEMLYAFFGVQVIFFYAVFSLTDAVMEGKVMLLMFVMLNAVVMANLSNKDEVNT